MISSAVPRVYGIADRTALGERSLPDAVMAMAAAGIRWIQIRQKVGSDRQLWSDVETCCRRLEGSGTSLWVDDRVDIAAALPVAGVHLGLRDLPVELARELLPDDSLIGQSTHTARQVGLAETGGADVIAIGPVFETVSKRNPDPVVGLSLVRRARTLTRRPLLAIGGIAADNLVAVLQAGADAVVLLGSLCGASDLERTARRMVTIAEAA